VFNEFEADDEMTHNVQQYVDYINSLLCPDSVLKIEQRVEFTDYVPDGFGTADAIIFKPDGTVHVCDLKYGQGVSVSAENNTQGQLYALGVLQEFGAFMNITRFEIHIIQPRKDNFSSWRVELTDLQAFGEYVIDRAKAAFEPNAPRTPSEKACRWCVHKANCVELHNYTSQLIEAEFDMIPTANEVPKLSDERKAEILKNKGLIELFLKAVEDSVFQQISQGQEFKGYKIVEGRSIRRWTNNAEAELAKRLGDDAFTKKLIGITEAQKHLGKEVVDSLTEKPSGKPTLVPETDKRKAVAFSTIEQDFEGVV
jgi:hypothetical protein